MSKELKSASSVKTGKKFSEKICQKYKINFNDNFNKIYNWSIENPEDFWSEYWDYSNIIGNKGQKVISRDKVFYRNKFWSFNIIFNKYFF